MPCPRDGFNGPGDGVDATHPGSSCLGQIHRSCIVRSNSLRTGKRGGGRRAAIGVKPKFPISRHRLDGASCRIDPPRINARFNRTEPTHLSLHAFRDAVVAVATTVRFYDDVDVSVLGPDGPDKAMSRAAKSIAST